MIHTHAPSVWSRKKNNLILETNICFMGLFTLDDHENLQVSNKYLMLQKSCWGWYYCFLHSVHNMNTDGEAMSPINLSAHIISHLQGCPTDFDILVQ
jgi:hypothetical protein